MRFVSVGSSKGESDAKRGDLLSVRKFGEFCRGLNVCKTGRFAVRPLDGGVLEAKNRMDNSEISVDDEYRAR